MGFITDAEFVLLYEESRSESLHFPLFLTRVSADIFFAGQNGAECTANLSL